MGLGRTDFGLSLLRLPCNFSLSSGIENGGASVLAARTRVAARRGSLDARCRQRSNRAISNPFKLTLRSVHG